MVSQQRQEHHFTQLSSTTDKQPPPFPNLSPYLHRRPTYTAQMPPPPSAPSLLGDSGTVAAPVSAPSSRKKYQTAPASNPKMEEFLKNWRQDALNKHQYDAAIFIGDKLLALTGKCQETNVVRRPEVLTFAR